VNADSRLPNEIEVLKPAFGNRKSPIGNCLPCCGQDNLKGSAHAHLTVKAYFSAVKLHRSKGLRQTDSGSTLLGRVVEIEYSFLIFFGDSDASIDHHYSNGVV
jgi:hypothetical protein